MTPGEAAAGEREHVRRPTRRTHLRSTRWGRRHERGAALVEAVFVVPVLLVLTLGIMEFGLAFSSSSTTTASSRSGARIAATNYATAGGTAAAQLVAANEIADAVSADLTVLSNAKPLGMVIYRVNPSSPDGAPVGGFPGPSMTGGCTSDCFRYSWNGTKMVYSSGGWASPDACGVTVDSIGVWVQTEHEFVSKMFGNSRQLAGHTVMRLEPLPTDQCGP